MPQGKLLAGDAACKVVHQILFAHGESLDDAALLPLEWLAFKNLGDAPAQKVDSGLHVFFERIGGATRQGQESRPVRQLEVIHVTTVQRGLGSRMQLFNHLGDGAAATGPCQAADKNVVAGSGQFHTHLKSAQGSVLPNETFALLCLRGSFKWDPREIAAPAELFGTKLYRCGYRSVRGRTHSRPYCSTGRRTTRRI